ncbi:MAG: STAS domain-containing protein [Actinobacteria bacterium]|nr:STAS domain-containing protein [Actinomycetota bacterium]
MTEGFALEVVGDVIRISGDLDAQTAGRLDEIVASQLAAGRTEIVLDLADLEFLDSSGLRSMVLARGPAGDRRVELRSPSGSVMRLLDITGLTEVFDIVG